MTSDYNWRNRHWTPANLVRLIQLWHQEIPIDAIAAELGDWCSAGAVTQRAAKMELGPRPQSQREWVLWPPEHCDFLEAQWITGTSAAKIALLINAKFRSNYTRSAIIGKAHRMKLPTHGRCTQNAGVRNKVQNTMLRQRAASVSLLKAHRKPPVAFPRVEAVKVLPDPKRPCMTAWEALEPTSCRYMEGEPNGAHAYCGHETVPGKAWCDVHLRRVYLQVDVRRRKSEWTDTTKQKIAELKRIMAD